MSIENIPKQKEEKLYAVHKNGKIVRLVLANDLTHACKKLAQNGLLNLYPSGTEKMSELLKDRKIFRGNEGELYCEYDNPDEREEIDLKTLSPQEFKDFLDAFDFAIGKVGKKMDIL